MKLEITKEQLELLKFMIVYEFDDIKREDLIASNHKYMMLDLLRVLNILKAQAKQPKAEW